MMRIDDHGNGEVLVEPPEPAAELEPPAEGDVVEEEDPIATGTLFVMLLFLMALAGMWLLMYLMLLGR